MKADEFYRQLKQRSLFEALHLIEQEVLRAEAQLGTDALPKDEKVSINVNPSLGYENAQLCAVKTQRNDKLCLETNLIGLTGEQGVLPQHYSELALSRKKEGDSAMVDFYDIFNHRLLSLYYRSWQLSQLASQVGAHSEGRRSPFGSIIESVTGQTKELANHFSGIFASPNRSKSALKGMLESLAGCNVRLHEFQGQWLHLSAEDQTRLVSKSMPEGQFAQLSHGASVGAKAWNINAGITIELFPNTAEQVKHLLPNTACMGTIKSLTHDFLGKHKRVKWKLTTQHKHLPQVCISKQQGQLGIGSVLTKHKRTKDCRITITI
ncbi:type VI secretion system baseplate subunit TssG [Vibrio hyugaensis]|uniref:Type VI secretion protein n=1 Tax=Vibrio hyugaensis TaxID=1534743 RepID=A0ABQ5Y5U1_9VIBR|nr:type VI secretion system baseplate subunit TssG [Vibrio hyugaensis]GLR04982.1 type VI secretion protein [Vibrio hyugaensis]